MNLQQEPLQVIGTALATALKAQSSQLKNATLGWPDTKWLGVDGNLPSVFFMEISETSKNVVSRYKIHKVVDNGDGTGSIYTEQLRLFLLLQVTLFTNTPQDRAAIGWIIKQYLVTNYRLLLSDGEYAMFKLKGDHQSGEGETNFYQRDLTFAVSARVLDATSAYKVTNLVPTYDISPTTTT